MLLNEDKWFFYHSSPWSTPAPGMRGPQCPTPSDRWVRSQRLYSPRRQDTQSAGERKIISSLLKGNWGTVWLSDMPKGFQGVLWQSHELNPAVLCALATSHPSRQTGRWKEMAFQSSPKPNLASSFCRLNSMHFLVTVNSSAAKSSLFWAIMSN